MGRLLASHTELTGITYKSDAYPFDELRLHGCLESASLITSLWSGTVKREMACIQEMQAAGVPYSHVHTSGHATEEELNQFVAAFPYSRVVPIHLEDREAFRRLFPRVESHNDVEWWDI